MIDLEDNTGCAIAIIGTICALIIMPLILWGYPKYEVWREGLRGQAELKRAEQNRQIAVEEAKAKKESAQALADAEMIVYASYKPQ